MPESPPTTTAAATSEEEEKFRLRRERAALWKKQQEEKRLKQLEEAEAGPGADTTKAQQPPVAATTATAATTTATKAATAEEDAAERLPRPKFSGFSLKPKTSAVAAPGKPHVSGFSLGGKKSTPTVSSGFAFKSAGSTASTRTATSPTTTLAKGALAAAVEDDDDDYKDPESTTTTTTTTAAATATMPTQKKLKLTKFSFDEEGSTSRKRSPVRSAGVPASNTTAAATPNTTDMDTHMEPAEDPLEAFMGHVQMEVEKLQQDDQKRLQEMSSAKSLQPGGGVGGGIGGIGSSQAMPLSDSEEEADGFLGAGQTTTTPAADEDPLLGIATGRSKRKEFGLVDHSTIKYEEVRKNFYVESPELAKMTPEEVEAYRVELNNIKIRGVHCPKPIKKWAHCGLPTQCEHILKQLQFKAPTPIQAQAIPAIMSGRDVIGVARTGSGKTMAFLLPMFRHVKDQRPLANGEGPIGVVLTPTRELALQIFAECKRFGKAMGWRVVCAYGGAPMKEQIADMKRGAEIAVCTPGRFIDLLCANSGKVTNLMRTTYLVLDEADRMFDMGFETQVMRIIYNVRKQCQRVLFSATFPKQMEALARRVLKKPLEITVGGKSIVCADVTQVVEIHDEDAKFLRLLEILGEWYNEEADQRMLIFVDRQEAADNLLRELFRRGYRCISLHGGKEQVDRDSTIADFKSGDYQIMTATSVAARGLDVRELNVVINYECPNHMEDYVHRVGRTGRAGRKGTAYTFISPDEERYVPEIIQALKASGAPVPDQVQKMADAFMEKVKKGEAHMPGSGFGGKGLERIEKEREMLKQSQKVALGIDEEEENDDETEMRLQLAEEGEFVPSSVAVKPAQEGEESAKGTTSTAASSQAAPTTATATAAAMGHSGGGPSHRRDLAAIAAQINAKLSGNTEVTQFHAEVEINDLPQKARWRATNRETLNQIAEVNNAALITRGTFVPPGKKPPPGERKLYIVIEGSSQHGVENAKAALLRVLKEVTAEMDPRALQSFGRYSVV